MLEDRLHHSLHRAAYAYWRSKAAEGRLPGRRDIDPVEIPEMLPWISLSDVIRDGEDVRFRFRLVGTGIVERCGRDVTGKTFEEAYHAHALREQRQAFARVANSGRPFLEASHLLAPGKEYVAYERLILPLARDGRHVDMILGVMGFADSRVRA
ncbi:PAS domain-containing protein [Ferruginivarius sediminum]|jgi:hypothetical protein|uniref:PAS domain-containing protein n=1 Tax=Ferruginivarius sediminum TaxID=2661937 RepID=A0A369TAQ5_9PROT|nr:PAS domain-containing protein [Ferruginivarius sediminum]RDD62370.1 PAS domain-containing protein [Ferruginivarius sediminum]